MPYKLTIYGNNYTFKSKDEVISYLMLDINGDGVNEIRLEYPDGSFYFYEGDDE